MGVRDALDTPEVSGNLQAMCHRYENRAETWVREERMDVRASDAERDAAVEALRAHAQAGRLTAEELEARVGQALAATTRADLAALQDDLPAARRIVPRRAPQRHGHVGFLPIALLLVTIWALTGAGYFWPMWPLLWFAFAGVMRTGHIRVTGNIRRTW